MSALATEVIRRNDSHHPADAVLREVLKRERGLDPMDAREVTSRVFTWFRWYGWVRDEQNPVAGLHRAIELNRRFRRDASAFSDDDLRARAVPGWVLNEVPATSAWLRSLQSEPLLWLRTRRGQTAALMDQLRATDAMLPEALLYQDETDLFRTPEFHAGQFELQDLSSQAVGLVCAPQPDETWWDACAGEGGKTLHLSDLMDNKGLIWASDRAAWRLQRLKRRAARAGVFNYRATLWDGSARPPTKTKFNGVLVDAPCSGVGTWQRNPHARWTTGPDDVKQLAAIQKNLLNHAAASVKPGGKLVYSVCTLTRSETEAVADDFERSNPSFTPHPSINPLRPDRPPTPRIWIWPQEFGSNGMFIAVWLRAATPAA